MLDKIIPVLLIVIVISASMAVGAYGYFLISKNQTPDVLTTSTQQTKIELLDSLKSSLVNTITIIGEVTEIFGNTITISDGKNNIVVTIENDREVLKLSKDSAGKNVYSKAKFSDIEIGNTLSIESEISLDNKLNGLIATIY